MNKCEEEPENYKLDIWGTIFINIFWVMIWGLIIMFMGLGYSQITQLENEVNYLLGLIVYFFAVVKLIAWNGKPSIRFKYV